MNSRIKELAEQCIYQVYDSNQTLYDKFNKEKFAELIILECALACEKSSWLMLNGSQRAKQIKEHFGVE